MTISVIIPVYNVESYLDECVQSVLNQTYHNLEIILVDDGSKDNSPQLCDDYVKSDSRIQVIHKNNGGLSDARNRGLNAASGEYVIFLDSDDYWLNEKLIETLVFEINYNQEVDLVLFLRTDYYENTNKHYFSTEYDIEKIKGKDRNNVFEYLLKNQKFNMSACFQIIRRAFLIENNLFFEKGLLSEDVDWSLNVWSCLRNISAVNIHGYCYRHRKNSITTTYSLQNLKSYEFMVKKWLFITENKDFDYGLKKLYKGYLAYLMPTLLYHYYSIPKADRKEEFNLLSGIKDVLQFSITVKSNRVRKINNIFGFKITCSIFGFYGLYSKYGFIGLKNIFK